MSRSSYKENNWMNIFAYYILLYYFVRKISLLRGTVDLLNIYGFIVIRNCLNRI